MRDRSVGPMAQWYLKHLEVPNYLLALLISSFPALVGLILGPIISVKSDRHRGPRGRRIPFLLLTTPIAATAVLGGLVNDVVPRELLGHFYGLFRAVSLIDGMAIGPVVDGIIDFTRNVYHHTFTVGCIVAVLALAISWAAHARFMKLGGPRAYVAPEPV